jgi:4-amino-4-deoxy-L-arabinose transferase-like glycosyltransferase
MKPNLSKIYQILKNNYFFFGLLSITLLWHLATLSYIPLPWFDETFFASISKSLAEGRGYYLDICPIQTNGREVLTYGPVYFNITALSFRLFGINAFAFRIVTLIFSALTIVAVGLILKKLNITQALRRLILLLIVFDHIIVISSHSGRMDLTAVFFALMAFYFYLSDDNPNKYFWMAIAGVAAVLTTPRIAIFLLPLFALAIYQTLNRKAWKHFSILIFIPTIIYTLWIIYGFGGFKNFLTHYLGSQTDGASSAALDTFHFIGGNFLIHYFQWPVIISSLMLFGFFIVKRASSIWHTAMIFLIPIALYYLLVLDTGRYSALVMPFWYLLLGWEIQNLSTTQIKKTHSKIATNIVLIGLLFINTGMFTLKGIQSIAAIPDHNPKPMKAWFADNLPLHSKIVGDDQFYYACVERQSELQYIYRTKSDAERAAYHAREFKPDYLLLCNETDPQTVEAYKKHFVFEETYHFIPTQRNETLDKMLQKLPLYIPYSYEARLIKVRQRENPMHE